MAKKRLIYKLLSTVLAVLFVLPIQPVWASEQSPYKNIELTYSIGSTDLDVSTFVYDVQTAVYAKYGITSDKIKITKAGASIVDSQNDFNWYTYDHYYSSDYPTDGTPPVDWEVYHGSNSPYYYYDEAYPADSSKYFTDASFDDASMTACYKRSNHIYPKDNGIIFLGYSEPAYKDFMVYPDANDKEKTITFTIDESGVQTHTLEGAGFLFNAGINDNKLNGYLAFYNYLYGTVDLYKLTNVDAEAFHNEQNFDISELTIPGIEFIARKAWGGGNLPQMQTLLTPDRSSKTNRELDSEGSLKSKSLTAPSNFAGGTKNIKVQVTNHSLKFFEDGTAIFDTIDLDPNIIIEDTGFGGFGPLVSYRSHFCSRLSYFTFKDLTMETYRPLTFLDLIHQQNWEDGTNRALINIDDDGVPEFGNQSDLQEIVSYMNSNGVHYIGWGRNNKVADVATEVYNKDQAEAFIRNIDGHGKFMNRDEYGEDEYTQGINAIADYIYSQFLKPETVHHGGGGSGGNTTVQTETYQFNDIENHWARSQIEKLASLKLVGGYSDRTFRPDNPITRAEFATLLYKVLNYSGIKVSSKEKVTFTDVTAEDWYFEAISSMAQEGIILGYGNGTFGPNHLITREEMATMVSRLVKKISNAQYQATELTYQDANMISPWAISPMEEINNLGIIQGLPDGNFYPKEDTTRAQAVVSIMRMLQKLNLI